LKISCFNDLAKGVKAMDKKPVVAVIEAQEAHTIESVISSASDGIIRPILIGDDIKIRKLIKKAGASPQDFEIIPSGGENDSIKIAVELIHGGEATALMKGSLETASFMKAVLSDRSALAQGSRLSLAGIFEVPAYHKLLAVTDMGLNTFPDFDSKRVIVENAVGMLRKLGLDCPKVAILSSVERLNPKQADTIEADALKSLGASGNLKNCVIEGPISFDLATSASAVKIKGYISPVAGDADLLVVPDVISGNILAKCLTGLAGAQTAGTVLGAKVPLILTSRAAASSDKYYSIALAAYLGAVE